MWENFLAGVLPNVDRQAIVAQLIAAHLAIVGLPIRPALLANPLRSVAYSFALDIVLVLVGVIAEVDGGVPGARHTCAGVLLGAADLLVLGEFS